MIEPKNKKLSNFHLLVAICFYLDFFMTGFIIGNYEFLHGTYPDENFLNHKQFYFFVIVVQAIDILLNFFKIQTIDVKEIWEPSVVAKNYLKESFITDCIALMPYNTIYPKLIILRYLKLGKFRFY